MNRITFQLLIYAVGVPIYWIILLMTYWHWVFNDAMAVFKLFGLALMWPFVFLNWIQK